MAAAACAAPQSRAAAWEEGDCRLSIQRAFDSGLIQTRQSHRSRGRLSLMPRMGFLRPTGALFWRQGQGLRVAGQMPDGYWASFFSRLLAPSRAEAGTLLLAAIICSSFSTSSPSPDACYRYSASSRMRNSKPLVSTPFCRKTCQSASHFLQPPTKDFYLFD